MPYIKKDLRPELYSIVQNFNMAYAEETLDKVVDLFATHRNFTDGNLNYFCTQLIRKYWNKTDAMIFSYMVIDKVLLTPLCYLNLERGLGLLYCMQREFKRREWGNEVIMEMILESVGRLYDDYEDKKKEENGDLE